MNNIKRLRIEKRITQKELAEAAKISQPFLYDLENGNRNAKPETWERICAALNCTIADLMEIKEVSE